MSALDLRSISKSFGTVAALTDVSLHVPAGSRTAIVGPSGSGKTTLLRIIAGFESADGGSVRLDAQVFSSTEFSVPPYRRPIGFVSQDGALFPHLNVSENIAFSLPRSHARRDALVTELMDLVELSPSMLRRMPDQLSGGQQQRVALARALARRPQLMLLDEPFSSLDTGLRAVTRRAMARVLEKANVTTVLVTHDQPEALSFADQVAVMRDGLLLQVDEPRRLYSRPKDAMIAEFLGPAIILKATIDDGWAICALGRVQVNSDGRRHAQIMLRPEQITLTVVEKAITDHATGTRPVGEITGIEFEGSVSTVAIRLLEWRAANQPQLHPENASDAPLILKIPSFGSPGTGAHVHFVIHGCAHVL